MAGPNIGFATLSVIPSARGFRGALASEVGGPVDQIGKESGGRFGKAFGLASKVALGGVIAGLGIGLKGLMDATGFQRQMNEVFTLLPDLSGEAMSKMTAQVKDFSSEFGVLPNEVVPALYQSISAGVPQENVFSFLETAQKAAKGGVTELTTAVDGISSVVNAYGSDVIEATEASDLMFTAVKLGKTDFEQLSSSLFNVIPTAAGLGVEFQDITAALAAMTAQGVPTSVATTQLRQLFVELSKDGGDTADMFEELAGKSFKEFIAQGGNTAEALGLMLEGADKLDVGVNDLFGSVEAGSAALSLAGSETFTANIDAMGASAGATQTAFEQMETGLGPIVDKIKARLSVASIEIGEWIAPHIEAGFAAFSSWWASNGATILGGLETVGTVFRETIFPALGNAATAFADLMQDGFQALSDWWSNNGDLIETGLTGLGDVINEYVLPALNDLWGVVKDEVIPTLGGWVTWIANNKYILVGFGVVVIGGLTVAMTLYAISAWAAVIATLGVIWPFLLAAVVIGGLAAAAYYAYENWGWFADGVSLAVAAIWGTVWGVSVLIGWIETLVGWLKSAYEWTMNLVEALDNIVSPGGSAVSGIANAATGGFLGALEDLPFGDMGGVMPGPRGQHSLAWVAGGETVVPTHRSDFEPLVPAGRGNDLDGLVVVLDSGVVAGRVRTVDSYYHRRNGG